MKIHIIPPSSMLSNWSYSIFWILLDHLFCSRFLIFFMWAWNILTSKYYLFCCVLTSLTHKRCRLYGCLVVPSCSKFRSFCWLKLCICTTTKFLCKASSPRYQILNSKRSSKWIPSGLQRMMWMVMWTFWILMICMMWDVDALHVKLANI